MTEVEGANAAPPDRAASRLGTVIDKYTIVRLLGRGGMGAVYEARHAILSRRFAIKFLLPEFAANREVLRRFENEAKAAGGLEHPNLGAVTDVGQARDGAPYLVMEYLQGEDAARLLRRHGPLAVRRAANIVLQCCRGLAVAHRAGIVHRDLKPENIFITDAGDGGDQIKVLDFGVAKLRSKDASIATGTGATFGTAFYMSPEQARGAGEVDHRSDVWSLGVVLFELLTARKPFDGGAFLEVIHKILSAEPLVLDALRPGLPPKLLQIIAAAMRKEVLERLPSVVALADALAPFAVATPGADAGPSVPTQASPVTAGMLAARGAAVIAPSVTASPGVRAVTTNRVGSHDGDSGRRRRGARWAAAVLLVAAALAAGLMTFRYTATRPVRDDPPRPAIAPVAPPVVAPAPVAAPPLAPTPSAPEPTAAAPTPRASAKRPAAPTQRPLSERRPDVPERVRSRGAEPPAAVPFPLPPPSFAPKSLSLPEKPRAGHPIEIEKTNPYDS